MNKYHLCSLSLALSAAAFAQPEYPQIHIRGFAAMSYGLNFPAPAQSRSLLRGYALDDRKLKLDGLNLDLQYGMSGEHQLGVRLDTVLGGSYPRIDAAAGLFRDPFTSRSNTDFDIRQAFVRYSISDDFSVDAGKFATHTGYEMMPGVDGKNAHATPAYGYTFNPFTHTGLRVNYSLNDELSVMALLVLGQDNFRDTNRSLSLGGQVNWHPNSDFSLIFNVLDGPERAYNEADRRRYYDVVANYKVHEAVNLGLHAFTSTEEGLAPVNGTAWVNGFSLYLQSQLSDKFWLNLRQEFYHDPFGIRLGTPARIRAFTFTPEYRFSEEWAMRIDFRFDKADNSIFDDNGIPVDYQKSIFFQQTLKF
ncbi:MAG: outer membrane beta-barrel protein [Candidatus Eremiobacteraeota bacterium]|nr:outer membrane beta-barrel protein [Candidatus Eremiobacteraeota bacterium]MCW5872681.1 outer membrane beta-barrel protein [Candidatus Eremiobacteraeota bacterium]